MQKPKRFSGGGGMVSTAGDYPRVTEMLLNGGKLGTTRVLSPSTVTLTTANSLRPGIGFTPAATRSLDSGPIPAMGRGFGPGFAVRVATGQNPLPGSPGSYYWNGANDTTFYVDPEEVRQASPPSGQATFAGPRSWPGGGTACFTALSQTPLRQTGGLTRPRDEASAGTIASNRRPPRPARAYRLRTFILQPLSPPGAPCI